MMIKNNKSCYIILISFCICIFLTNYSYGQNKKSSCDEWHNKIDSNKSFVFINIENKTENEILFGMNCLLQLKGKKMDSNVRGASRGDVSEIFFATSVEVAALYYISYLFYDKWDHADAPFLIDKNQDRNTKEAVCEAYKAYKKWFKKVKKIGLEEAKKQKLDPLADSDVSWY